MKSLIPKIFHRTWFGPHKIPDIFEEYWRGWQAKHPDYQFITWNEDRLFNQDFKLDNRESFDKAMNYSEQSDIARYEIIQKLGGIYLDTDFECLHSIDKLLLGVTNFCSQLEANRLAVGIIGATPNHSLYRHLVGNIKGNFRPSENSETAGPLYYTAVVELWQARNLLNDLTVFQRSLFYPYHYGELAKADQDFSDSSYAVHRWATTYRDPNFVKKTLKDNSRIGVAY